MKTVVHLFEQAFKIQIARKWEKIYILVDIHETLLLPTYSEKLSTEFYKMSKKCMQILSDRTDVCLIQWSSSSVENNKKYQMFFDMHDIKFDYINENPEIESTSYADFISKPYMNIIIDDKSGWEQKDWKTLYKYLTTQKQS